MEKLIWINRGIDEQLIIGGKTINGIDTKSPLGILSLLAKNNIIELEEVSFDKYKGNKIGGIIKNGKEKRTDN